MLNFYKTVDNRILKIDAPEPGCWISVVSPTEAEVAYLTGDLGVEPDFVRAALDEEESSRIESEEDQTLVIVDYPSAEEQTDENKTLLYTTLPMGIIITRDYVITVCLNDNLTIEVKQAIEMCNIYSGILSGMMDAFASVISNNLNIVMKVLTAITIVMAIPNMVFSFYGMNVSGLPFPVWWVPIVISLIIAGIGTFILVKKDMFH